MIFGGHRKLVLAPAYPHPFQYTLSRSDRCKQEFCKSNATNRTSKGMA